MKIYLIILFLLGCTISGYSQTLLPDIPKLNYKVSYNWGFIWIRAGKVRIIQEDSDKYPNASRVFAVGHTIPSRDIFFKVRDTLESYFDKSTLFPYEFSRKAHEGRYHKTFDYMFDYNNSAVYGKIHKLKKYKRQDTTKLLDNTYDMLSSAWMMRNIDFNKLKENDKISVNVFIDSKIYNLYVRYKGIHTLEISGDEYKCYVLSPLLIEGDVFKEGENMNIWVSTDKNRIPLMIESKILVGSIKAILDFDESILSKEDIKNNNFN